jgi:hypothetical protein
MAKAMSRDTPAVLFDAQLSDVLFLRRTRRRQGESERPFQGSDSSHFLMSQPAEESGLARLLQEISGNVTRRAHAHDVKASPIAAGIASGGLFENSPAGEKRGAVCAFGDRKKLSALVVEQNPAAVSRDNRPDTA